MKINGGKPLEKTDVIRPQKPAKNDKATGLEKGVVTDTVKVSGIAREIAEIVGAVKSLPDARQDKVEEIKKQINSGDYVIDTYKIAGKMLDEAT